MNEPVEIADICVVLEKLGHSEVLPASSAKACLRGAYLLRAFRETVFAGRADSDIVATLKDVLAKNQEG